MQLLKFASLVTGILMLTSCGGGGGGTTAGTPDTTKDTTAPTTTAAPAVSGINDTTATLSVTVNENGTGYYLVQPAAAAAATQAQVLAGTSFTLTANVPASPLISGLTANTHYTIYFVAKDAANNVQTAVQSVPVTTTPTTTAGYVTQGGLTWTPVTFFDKWENANTYCTTTTINGLTGWRLPTQPELSALFTSGAMNGQGWTLGPTWSSTSVSAGHHYEVLLAAYGQMLEVGDGFVSYVTCVR